MSSPDIVGSNRFKFSPPVQSDGRDQWVHCFLLFSCLHSAKHVPEDNVIGCNVQNVDMFSADALCFFQSVPEVRPHCCWFVIIPWGSPRNDDPYLTLLQLHRGLHFFLSLLNLSRSHDFRLSDVRQMHRAHLLPACFGLSPWR